MRIAVFSDVHGNLEAMQAVVKDIETRGAFDAVYFAGDLVFGAANPQACYDLLHEKGFAAVYGNTDEFLWNMPAMPEGMDEAHRQRWQHFAEGVSWTKSQLSDAAIAWLRALPFELRLRPTENPADDLLITHANPQNIHDPIHPNFDEQLRVYEKVRQLDDPVRELLVGVSARTVVFGHIHIPNLREVDDYQLFNIASVSRPLDGDWRAKYGILSFANGRWSLEHVRVPYDVEAARAAIMASDCPSKEDWAALLIQPES